MGGQIESYMHICKYEAIHESYFMIAEMWKSTPKNTYTKQQNQNQPAISQKKKLVLFWKYIFPQSKKRLIKYFLANNSLFQGVAVFTWKTNQNLKYLMAKKL